MISRPRYIHSLYCDDVRMEVGGKMSFVGVYQGQLIIHHNGPVTLPKLCIVATAQTPKEQPFERLLIKLLQDDVVVQELETPLDVLSASIKMSDSDDKSVFHNYGLIITLQPFNIMKNCVLRIRAETESEELMASGLQVILAPEEDIPAFTS